jgi:hypothetical protein
MTEIMNHVSLPFFIFVEVFPERPGAIPVEMPDLALILGVH